MTRPTLRAALVCAAAHLLAAALAAQSVCPNPIPVVSGAYTTGDHSACDPKSLPAANFVIGGSATATFYAGQTVDLQPGFHATAGGPNTFHAWVDSVPYGLSVSPASGSGVTSAFTFSASSPAGYGDLYDMEVIIGSSHLGQNSCYFRYYPQSNTISLADNSGNWPTSAILGTPGSQSNSQCSIDIGHSSASFSGNQVALTVPVTFQPSYMGGQTIYLIAYDTPGLTSEWLSVGSWTVAPPPPAITNITPSSAAVGTSVTIAGSNFGTTQGSSTVTFNGIAAAPTSWSAASITVPVPASATTGPVIVTVSGTPSNNVNFTVLPTPVITSLSPSAGPAGTAVVISGSHLGATQGSSTLTFNGIAASASNWSDTSVTTTVPASAATGSVVITVNGVPSAGVSFTVLPTPVISGITPSSATAGASVTIAGSNFGTTQGSSTVTFNGLPATATSWSNGAITVTVPGGAITGPVVVSENGVASNAVNFTVNPPTLTITATASSAFTQGQTGATYNLTVGSLGVVPTDGTAVTVAQQTPTGLIPTSIAGTNWTCTQPAGPCTRSDVLAAGATYPPVTLTANVSQYAPASVTNQATVVGGGLQGATTTTQTPVTPLQRYANPLAFATSASVVGGVATTLSITYTNDNGPSDIASGQVKIDQCYLAWDSSGNIRLYSAHSGYSDATGVLGQSATLFAGNCSISLANSSLTTQVGNPKALVLKVNIAFPNQAYLSTSDTDVSPDFIGPHEVYAWGVSAEGLSTGQVDLGSMVVSQGPDFTLNVSPNGVITVPPNANYYLTVSATGLNGFSQGLRATATIVQTSSPSGPVCLTVTPSTTVPINLSGTLVVTNSCNSSQGGYTADLYISGTPSNSTGPSVRRGAANGVIKLIAPNLGDFSMGVSTPSAPVLAPLSSVQYPITVSSVNGGSGAVSLSVVNLPAGVTASLPQSTVPLDTPVTMTLTSTSSALPGTFAVQLSGQLNGGALHTTNFPVSTQVNTFQVTSLTGGAIVHNNGQEVQVTHTVPQGNAPNFTTCDTPDPNVTCRVISSAPGAVTLGITAGSNTTHGTRVLSLNGGRATVHAAMADFGPGGFEFNLPSIEVQAGRYASAYASLPPEDCYIDGPCGYAVLESSVGWIQALEEADQIEIFANPPVDVAPGSYSYSVVLCTGSFLLENNATCLEETGDVEVDAPPTPVLTITTSDNIMVLNPPLRAVAQVLLLDASGTVSLSAIPSGSVSFSRTSLNLADGVPALVSITPLQQSQAPNDIHIVASYNQGNTVGSASMTIVNIVIPAIRNADTPTNMPDRMPPRVDTPITVTVSPDLTGSGQKVTLETLNTSVNNGYFTISGASTLDIVKTTTVNLSSTTQTTPTGIWDECAPAPGGGNAGQLKLVAMVNGQAVVLSAGFSVAAIPINFTNELVGPLNDGIRYGMVVQSGWTSDSGDIDDLEGVCQMEQVEKKVSTGVLAGIGITAQLRMKPSTIFPTDTHGVPISYMTGTGTLVLNQTQTFQDYRTGANNVPMMNSGFMITHSIAPDNTGVLRLTTTKTGAAVTANGFSSAAGTCFTPPSTTPVTLTVVQP